MRAQRLWWVRNGAFFRGFLLGACLAGAAAWVVVRFL
jgi:hypothetical protein